MNEDRFARRLRVAEAPETPDRAFVERLYADLASELGFARPGADVAVVPTRAGARSPSRRTLLLAAALLVSVVVGAMVAGALLVPRPGPVTEDLLAQLQKRGRIGIAASRDHPQLATSRGAYSGFDLDVAAEIAARLGLVPDVVLLDRARLLANDTAWDLAMSAAPLTQEQAASLTLIEPVYAWPVVALVPAESSATGLASLAGARVGVTAGSGGARWLAAADAGTAAGLPVPPGIEAVTVARDLECLDLLDEGGVVACVTSTLGPADLATRPHLRSLGTVVDELRGPLLRRDGPDAGGLELEVRRAIEDLRADGTLSDLSWRRFGTDLTTLPS